jgi:hypothetical protein
VGIDIALAGLLALAAVLLFVYFRRVRIGGGKERSSLFLGFFRGCAVVLVATLTWLLYDPVTMTDPHRDVIGLAVLATIGIVIVLGLPFRRLL